MVFELKCFIEENSMNIGKIASLSFRNILSSICECLCYNCTNISIFVQYITLLHLCHTSENIKYDIFMVFTVQ